MNPDTAKIIDRLVMSRDGLQKLDIADYAMIREAREAMADAANALTNYAKTAVLIDQAGQVALVGNAGKVEKTRSIPRSGLPRRSRAP